jgi:hypothetical protein
VSIDACGEAERVLRRKVRVVHETEGTAGYVYMDLFSRPNKFSHAANFAIQFSHLQTPMHSDAGSARPWVRDSRLALALP